MRVIRSWPCLIPAGRTGYVMDDAERLPIDNCDYRPLGAAVLDRPDIGVVLLEWDVAVSQEDLVAFAAAARGEPDRVLVAPYRIYPGDYPLGGAVWAHRHWAGDGAGTVIPVGAVPVDTDDPVCQLFGLGMCYLPTMLVRGFLAAGWSTHFGDVEFSMWHYQHVRHDVPIMWSVHPVHLHYSLKGL